MTNNIRAETLPLPVLQSKSMDREVRRVFLQLSPLRLMSIKNTSVESVRRSWQLCVKAFASREPVGAVVEKRDCSTVAGSHLPMAAEGIEWLQSRISRLTDLNDPTISPLRSNDLVGLPPALVLTAGFDPLREEALAYARRLASSGVSVRQIHFPGQFHGFLSFDNVLQGARDAFNRLGSALATLFDSGRLEPGVECAAPSRGSWPPLWIRPSQRLKETAVVCQLLIDVVKRGVIYLLGRQRADREGAQKKE